MNVTAVKVSNGGLLLTNGTGVFEIGEDSNTLSCGVFTTYPQQHKKYSISFKYMGQTFNYQMVCTFPGKTSKFVGPRTNNDPAEP